MNIFSHVLNTDKDFTETSVEKMRNLYGRMDRAYDRSASGYDFSCKGCDENCCQERFYHHTLAEFLYLRQGIQSLDGCQNGELLDRAREVVGLYGMHDLEGQSRKIMCPVNSDGLCGLYVYRPMICRLHGVPYRMRRPNGAETQGAGCHEVDWDMSPEKSAECMCDRTDFYRELSVIEIELRQRFGFGNRINLTIAEMIIEIEKLLHA
jgi:Fe-S-cluster containining protein